MNRKNVLKTVFQVAVLILLIYMGLRLWLEKSYIPDFEAYCPFGGLQAIGSFLTLNSLSCSMTSMQIMMGIMVFLAAILFSKLFCSFICPIGTISEWIGKLGDKLKIRITVGENIDSSLRAVKYILLFATFYFTLTTSELFCKKFDPYYAVVSGFNSDVVILYAVISLAVFLLGSLFFRFFWCRYLCPFGALINIFRYSWWFLGIAGVFIILSLIGISIPLMVPLIVLACTGYVLEILKMKSVKPSLIRITRNTETCTSCNICNKSCPQGIEVSDMKVVKHIDCNFCGDCVYSCPEKDTLQINRKNRKWLPATVVGILIIAGLILGSIFEFPTIDVKWGTKDEIASAATYTQSGLKNVKCFGSSTVFANKMRNFDGIYGVSTFVKTNTVKILYDQKMYNDTTIQKLIFVPEKRVIAQLTEGIDSVFIYTVSVDGFFDPLDAVYLQYLLKQKTNALAYRSDFGCPVLISIYFPAGKQPDIATLKSVIQSPTISFEESGIQYNNVILNYRVVKISEPGYVISSLKYIEEMSSDQK